MEHSPKDLYKDYKKFFTKDLPVDQLISFIENVDRFDIRIESLNFLQRVAEKDKRFRDVKVFQLLENLLLSDSNESIRRIAAQAISDLFLDHTFEPMRWAFQHEKSINCLITISRALGKINSMESKSLLINELEKSEYPQYNKLDALKNEDASILAEYYINLIILRHLEKKYERIDYSVEKGMINSLDLSYIGSQVFKFNVLRTLPEFIGTLKELKKLDLKINRLTYLVPSIGSLYSLEYLDLSYNKLKILPDSIGALKSLKTLYIRYNNLETIPESLGNLSNLEILDLRKNQIAFLPDSIQNLRSLVYLDLQGNCLSEVPDSIGNLVYLRKLELGLNELNKIPNSLSELTKLQILGLGGNLFLNYIPEWIPSLKGLKEFYFYDNALIQLPEFIESLECLEILDLRNNKLSALPSTFSNLKHLKTLNLSWNRFTQLPDSISELEFLEELNLWGNKLEYLPNSLLSMKSLKRINLNFNKLKSQNEILNSLQEKGVQITI